MAGQAVGTSFDEFAREHPDAMVQGPSDGDGSRRARVTIWTDGSSRGNPGPGGYGAVLLYTDPSGAEHTKELSCGYARTTNNRMELMAAIKALESLKRQIGRAHV